MSMMKVLAITNLFPNNMQSGRGIFNKQQFVPLSRHVELKVVSPLPWFPSFMKDDHRSVFARVSNVETIAGIKTYHPRYLVIPKIGRMFYGYLFYKGILKTVETVHKTFPFDIILATWAYPDAYGASLIARRFRKPLVIKVHGTDVNVVGRDPIRRRMIKQAFGQSYKVIAVTQALKEKITGMGLPSDKVVVIPNGVDKERFRRMDKDVCREKLGLRHDRKHIVFIGNLVPIKGIKYLIEAMAQLPADVQLDIVGDGELHREFEQRIKELNLSGKVQIMGRRPHEEIVLWMNAADIFCLPSLNEGCPNVVLEALACGTPVVASNVGGIPEIITSDKLGSLVRPEDSAALSKALSAALGKRWDARFIEQHTAGYDWSAGAERIRDIFKEIMDKSV